MLIGLPKETRLNETRVGLTPDAVRKLSKKGFQVRIESGCGIRAGFLDADYVQAGAECGDQSGAFSAQIVLKLHRPTSDELQKMKPGSVLIAMLEPHLKDSFFEALAQYKIDALAMERIPRTSRAQSMDVLSSQANIAGYRAVLEAAVHYGRFFPLMMTSAGSSKPCKLVVLGAGVAGLQAIATAKRLGASVEAYDIRPEVKEQIQSLGAKLIEFELGETGTGKGGYAQELSSVAQQRQQELLADRLKKADVIISTANVPGRPAPRLIPESVVRGMRPGSVIIDMAAGNGGNCALSRPDQVILESGVKIVGYTQYASLLPSDASAFYANNLIALLGLLVDTEKGPLSLKMNLQDDIINAVCVTYQGALRL